MILLLMWAINLPTRIIFFEFYLVDIRIENIKDTTQAPIFCKKGNGMIDTNKYDEVEDII